MIRKINYVWLGGGKLPANVESCIQSWKKYLPDWEIVKWNESNFNVNKYRWVREALSVKKYAFAADFIRMYVLLHYGGIYMDTDVQLYNPVETILTDSFLTGLLNHHHGTDFMNKVTSDGYLSGSHEECSGFGIQVGFMYSEPNHPFVKDFMEKVYENGQRRFINDDGTYNELVIDGLMMRFLCDEYNAKFVDTTQRLNGNITLYDSSVFATRKTRNKNTVAVHWFDQSWMDNTLLMRLKKFIKYRLFFLYRNQ